jgi:ABC-2 type transport system ATP-binding protein
MNKTLAGSPIVEVDGITKKFGEHVAVDYLSLSVREGEFIGLLGPNGAGKTTIMHMLLGLTLPTAGSIRVFGMEMPKERGEVLKHVNFTSAYIELPLALTPWQNLMVFGRLYGVRDLKERAKSLLERFGLREKSHDPTRDLSAGQLARLNIAKALLNDPALLLLDEPTASMDLEIAEQTRSLLVSIHKERRITMVYTSHNLREVENIATRVLFLNKGQIIIAGKPKDLVSHFEVDNLEQVFLKLIKK